MWQKEIWGNTLATWGISILFILGAIVIVKLFTWLSRKVIRPFVSRTHTQVDDVIYYSFESPLKFGVILLGTWIGIHKLVYPDSFVKIVDNAYKIMIALTITWIIARLLSGLLQLYWQQRPTGHLNKMLPVIRRSLLVVVWIVGLVTALSNIGVNISAVLGTLGIGGIAFALAAQDTVKNVFGAFTIFTDRPFMIGDTIRVDNFEGTVVDVGVRSTRVMDYDKRIITFPNYKITDASIINISSEPMRRVITKLGLTYDTTPDKMKQAIGILRSLPSKVENVSDNPSDIVANFSDYADSAMVITYIYFIKKEGDIGKVTSDMNMAILDAFNQAGLDFAFPTQTIYLEGEEKQEDTAPKTAGS